MAISGRARRVVRAVVAAAGVLTAAAALKGRAEVGLLAGPHPPQASLSEQAVTLYGLPVVTEHRYRMSAKIRPLLLFWIGRDNVGGARLRWRRGENGDRGYDLLIGSDPARAPRRINRWGFLLEETRGNDTKVVGVMKKSDEDSLDEAKAGVANEGSAGIFFKMIQARSDAHESVATVTITRVARDYSYRELDSLLDALVKFPGQPRIRKVAVPAAGRPGFLGGLAELLHDAVDSVTRTHRAPARKSVAYAYFGKQYDLSRTSAGILTNVTLEGVTYARLVQSEFEVRARGDPSKETFTITCGVDGPLAEIPVFVSYQPKWWFRADMVLDEREVF
jgi:hypothetical protein